MNIDIEEFKQWLRENSKYKAEDYHDYAKLLIDIFEETGMKEYVILAEFSSTGKDEVYVF